MHLTGRNTGEDSKDDFQLKQRLIYATATLLTMLLGLASRAFAEELPDFIARHAGDALWSAMIYFGFRVLFVQQRLVFTMLLSLMFCYAIEFSQLVQTDWLNRLRSTVLGALVLGHGFLVIDLLRYTIGIGMAAALDLTVRGWANREGNRGPSIPIE
ncbi:ribosomal maturation YjgA family protein [Paenibacillus jiagnxiensis]|uniref:ribosomal maturation YjgA family protein n=1 Tax=Paenibacillus jiagnxiensis TaxID=3228926 RepID=UPI0033B466F1